MVNGSRLRATVVQSERSSRLPDECIAASLSVEQKIPMRTSRVVAKSPDESLFAFSWRGPSLPMCPSSPSLVVCFLVHSFPM